MVSSEWWVVEGMGSLDSIDSISSIDHAPYAHTPTLRLGETPSPHHNGARSIRAARLESSRRGRRTPVRAGLAVRGHASERVPSPESHRRWRLWRVKLCSDQVLQEVLQASWVGLCR